MDIEKIKEKIRQDKYEISVHAEKERYVEDITILDLETAITNGKILEHYPNDKRGESCLILGYSKDKPIHIVCGYTVIEWIRVITVYIPKSPKWIDEKIRAKGVNTNA